MKPGHCHTDTENLARTQVAVCALSIGQIFVERFHQPFVINQWRLTSPSHFHHINPNQILLRRDNALKLSHEGCYCSCLCESLTATGRAAEWIKAALVDLPVLTQIALNIASLLTALPMGKQVNPSEAAAIQNISAEAGKDLTLLQALYAGDGQCCVRCSVNCLQG